jgi:hypothetical protein
MQVLIPHGAGLPHGQLLALGRKANGRFRQQQGPAERGLVMNPE